MGYPPRDQSGWDRRDGRPPQPRQSSAAVACRATVMVGCLVGLVGAALFGTALPDLVKGLLSGSRPADTETAGRLASEAPPFNAPASSEPQAWPSDASQNLPVWPDRSRQAPPPLTAAAGQNVPQVPRGAEVDRRPAPNDSAPITSPRGIPPIGAVQASYESWAGQPSDNSAPSHEPYPVEVAPPSRSAQDVFQQDQLSRATPSPQPRQPVDRFTYILTRLRELGATYYLLENWGASGDFFRFHCRMAVGGTQDCSRQFEATESDALQAMTHVLEEVESWRGAR